jgi:hypothetical protein
MITSIHKLPLRDFIDCLVDQDYSSLDAGDQERKVWEDILYQYTDALGDDGSKRYLIALREYTRAKQNYEEVNRYIELLGSTYVPKWAKELNRLVDAKIQFTPHDREEYVKQLKRCVMRNAGNRMRYQIESEKFLAIQKLQVEKEGEKPTRESFAKTLLNLKDFKSREIPDTVTTYEFCIMVNQMIRYVKEKEGEKRGRR